MQTDATVEKLLEAARKVPHIREHIEAFARTLSASEPIVPAILKAAELEEGGAFIALTLGAVAAGHTLPSEVVSRAVSYLTADEVLAVSMRADGDVAGALWTGAKSWLRQNTVVGYKTALTFFAIEMAGEKAKGTVPAEAREELASVIRRMAPDSDDSLILFRTAELTGDPSLVEKAAQKLLVSKKVARKFAKITWDDLHEAPLRYTSALEDYSDEFGAGGVKAGRNDPCPCGSGKKFKKCCQNKPQSFSPVPGVSLDKYLQERERYLSHDDILDMSAGEMTGLDFTRLPDGETKKQVFAKLSVAKYFIALKRFLATLEPGELPEYVESANSIIVFLGELGSTQLQRAMVEGYRRAGLTLEEEKLPLFLRLESIPSSSEKCTALQIIDEAARKAVAEDDVGEMEHFARQLLQSPYAELGILVAQGVAPSLEEDEAWDLYEDVGRARERLGLPEDYLLADTLDRVWPPPAPEEIPEDDEDDENDEAANEALLAAQVAVDQKSEELKSVHAELAQMRRKLEERAAEPDHSAGESKRIAPQESVVSFAEMKALRQRYEQTKEELKSRHREKNEFKKELDKARSELQKMKSQGARPTPTAPAPEEDDGFEPLEIVASQPARLPVYSKTFQTRLAKVPAHVARLALRTIGEMAAGDQAGFRGVKYNGADRSLLHQRIGISYRLFLKIHDHELEILDIVSREDFVKSVKSFVH